MPDLMIVPAGLLVFLVTLVALAALVPLPTPLPPHPSEPSPYRDLDEMSEILARSDDALMIHIDLAIWLDRGWISDAEQAQLAKRRRLPPWPEGTPFPMPALDGSVYRGTASVTG